MSSLTQAFSNRRMLIILLLGFASGLPLALTGGTLQAWMTAENIDVKVIGLFALVGWPYTLKFVWSPVMDRFVPPFLGRRRGWMLICQLALVGLMVLMAFSHPAQQTMLVALVALLISFVSASQDIVIDAYRTEILHKDELGPGAGVSILGYRLAMLASGAGGLILADHLPWRSVYLVMASLLGVGIVTTFIAAEPIENLIPPRTLRDAVVIPFTDFFRRRGALEMILFIIFYKIGDAMALGLSTNFMLGLGFSRTEIGAISKGFGLAATLIGGLLGGAMVTKLGMKRALLIFGFLQGISVLLFAVLASVGKITAMLALTIGVENLCSGMGTAAFAAFLMMLCNRSFTATQYALLSSLASMNRVYASSVTGHIVAALGWEWFFVVCTVAALPALILIYLRYDAWMVEGDGTASP